MSGMQQKTHEKRDKKIIQYQKDENEIIKKVDIKTKYYESCLVRESA